MQPTAIDSDKEKKQRGQTTVEAKRAEQNNKEFKSRKHVPECLHKPGIVLLAPTKPAV